MEGHIAGAECGTDGWLSLADLRLLVVAGYLTAVACRGALLSRGWEINEMGYHGPPWYLVVGTNRDLPEGTAPKKNTQC